MRQGKLSELIHNSVSASTSPKKTKGPKKGKKNTQDDEDDSEFSDDDDTVDGEVGGGPNSCTVEVHFREIVDLVRFQ